MAEKYSLKDDLFNPGTVAYLSGLFQAADPAFDGAGFQSAVLARFPELELRARIDHIARVLADFLPADFPQAARRIHQALPPPLDPELRDNDFGRFILAPLGEFVVNHGLTEHFECSIDLLHALTMRFSMEFSLRPFLNHRQEDVMGYLRLWADDPNYHVRRLVSEATRPKLPWGKAISLAPGAALPLLDLLYADKARYVTRSVANHLNDIGKTDPDLVVETLKRWAADGRQHPVEMAWITRHALRSLVKKGNAGALELLGFRAMAEVAVAHLAPDRDTVAIGEAFSFSTRLTAAADEALMVDYVIDFVKANGKRAPKVFKLKQLSLKAGESVELGKKHLFKKGATTFTHYPGVHRLTLQVNGQQMAGFDFTLQ